MSNERKTTRAAVRRDHAGDYVLTSLIAFGATVYLTRAFLQLTGFPQIGNSVLHIAHALWGGILLFVAVLLPLAYANRWAIWTSAILSGIGIGLFIDEVGKFVTQANDYFYPPAMALIYGFFLLTVFVYLYVRRPQHNDPRTAMYHALERLHDALDGDLNTVGAARIEAQLAIARQSDRGDIVSLANAISTHLKQEKQYLSVAQPGFWDRIVIRVDRLGLRLGRRAHHTIISVLLVLWVALVIGYISVLVQGNASIESQVVQWRSVLVGVQVAIGGLMIVAAIAWLTRHEELGLKLALGGFLLSLVALQTLYFYLSQFSAITATLLQLAIVLILLAYRRWHLGEEISHDARELP